MATASASPVRDNNDDRYAVDIRVFVSVIVIAMAISFGVGVGLGPTTIAPVATTPATITTSYGVTGELPKVTSVEVAQADQFGENKDLHEPAGQVRGAFVRGCQ